MHRITALFLVILIVLTTLGFLMLSSTYSAATTVHEGISDGKAMPLTLNKRISMREGCHE